jgi:hypothetical protein
MRVVLMRGDLFREQQGFVHHGGLDAGNDQVGGRFDPFAVGVDASAGVNGAEDAGSRAFQQRAVLGAAIASVPIAAASASAIERALNDSPILGGTLHVVLENKNGAVVLIDSVLCDESGPAPVPHPERPGTRKIQWVRRRGVEGSATRLKKAVA